MGLRNHEGTKMPTVATRSGMHVEEAEDLRLGIAEGVEDRAGLERGIARQIDHHLHAHGPFALVMARAAARIRWSSWRPTAPTGPSPTTVRAA